MSFLVRFTARDGRTDEVFIDELCVGDVTQLERVEQRVQVLGQEVVFAFTFDPPLRPVEEARRDG